MKDIIIRLLDSIVEVNFTVAIVGFFIVTSILGHQGCINDAAQDKLHQHYMVNCVNKGMSPSDCAIGWKASRTP